MGALSSRARSEASAASAGEISQVTKTHRGSRTRRWSRSSEYRRGRCSAPVAPGAGATASRSRELTGRGSFRLSEEDDAAIQAMRPGFNDQEIEAARARLAARETTVPLPVDDARRGQRERPGADHATRHVVKPGPRR